MVSIIIVNYNQKDFLKECLKSIKEANISIDYEIVIVDNNSKDNSLSFLNKFKKENKNVKVIFNQKNLGYARAVNQGIKNSKGDHFLIVNPDIVVLPGSVENLYQFMEKNPKIGIVGPKLLNPDKTLQLSCFRFPKWYIPILRRSFLRRIFKKAIDNYLMADWKHDKEKEVDWILGAAIFVRKKAVEDVGLMDERFFLYFEDIDWCYRFHLKNWRVFYYPKAKMIHFYQKMSAKRGIFNKFFWIHLLSGIKYFKKWFFKK